MSVAAAGRKYDRLHETRSIDVTGDRPQDVVARGYDAGADRFAAWQREITDSKRFERLDELLGLLPARPDVLELGSGAGVRSTRILAERTSLVGIDISAEQVRRARERVPDARFVHADFTQVELELVLVRRSRRAVRLQPRSARRALPAARTASPRGSAPRVFLLASFGASDLPGWYGEALGRGGDVLQRLGAGGNPTSRSRSGARAGTQRARDDRRAGGPRYLSLGVRPKAGVGSMRRA